MKLLPLLPATLGLLILCPGPGWAGDLVLVDNFYTNAGSPFIIGSTNPLNSLIVTNQGWLENGQGILGQHVAASENRALVTGTNSFWENTTSLCVGDGGAGNRLEITQGGRVNAPITYVGLQPTSVSNSVTVQAAVWESPGGLRLGVAGQGNRVSLTQGARLQTGGLSGVGYSAPSSRNTMSLHGPGTIWISLGTLGVGSFGSSYNLLQIAEGTQVYDVTGRIGSGPGNAVEVTGPGSVWGSQGVLFVGNGGASNLLQISAGARVFCNGALLSGLNNRIQLIGPSSTWDTGGNAGQLVVGDSASQANLLEVSQGATLLSWAAYLGGTSNIVTLTSPSALWQNSQQVVVGQELSQANQLSIAAGARVTAGTLSLAGQGGSLQLADPASTLEVSGFISVGDEAGRGNRLIVAGGAQLLAGMGYIGGLDTPFMAEQNDGNTAVVTGTGSRWINEQDLTVGVTGPQSQLLISAGARLESRAGYVGFHPSSADNVVTVTDPDSLWRLQGDLYLGRFGSGNRLSITNGATVRSASAWIGWQQNADNSVTVTGPGSTWSNTGTLTLGLNSARNQLVVSNGAHATAAAVSVGSDTPNSLYARSNVVVVTGPESSLLIAGPLFVGAQNPLNLLRIEEGGTVTAASLLLGTPTPSFSNRLEVSRARLFLTQASGAPGPMLLRHATLIVSNALVTCGTLTATNGAQNPIRLHSGTLQATRALLRIGRPFQVGEGLDPATLSLTEPERHSFPDGLVVAEHAALAASGVIQGSLTNAGSLHIGHELGHLAVEGHLALASSATVTFDLAGYSPGTNHDTLRISGQAILAGALRVRLQQSFVPSPLDVFTILTFDSSLGAFQNAPQGARLPVEADHAAGSFLVALSGQSLQLRDFQGANPPSYSLPEEWVLQYFERPALSGQELFSDPDQDGLTTYEEYIAGTVPIDPHSVFKLLPVQPTPAGHFVLRFPCSPERTYTLSFSLDLISWRALGILPEPSPAPGLCQWVDDGSQTGELPPPNQPGTRFYRLSVR